MALRHVICLKGLKSNWDICQVKKRGERLLKWTAKISFTVCLAMAQYLYNR